MVGFIFSGTWPPDTQTHAHNPTYLSACTCSYSLFALLVPPTMNDEAPGAMTPCGQACRTHGQQPAASHTQADEEPCMSDQWLLFLVLLPHWAHIGTHLLYTSSLFFSSDHYSLKLMFARVANFYFILFYLFIF